MIWLPAVLVIKVNATALPDAQVTEAPLLLWIRGAVLLGFKFIKISTGRTTICEL